MRHRRVPTASANGLPAIGNNERKLDGKLRSSFMVRGHGWKDICHTDGTEYLYHLAVDPDETMHLAGDPAQQQRKEQMITALHD